MFLEKHLPHTIDDNKNLMCIKKDEALEKITLYIKPNLIHHTKDDRTTKEICNNFYKLFWIVNSTKVNRLETELTNIKMGDFDNIQEYTT
jgi:hypothetical protein